MADYVPVIQNADSYTLTSSAALTGGQLVAVTGVNTVGPAGANASNWVGVAAFDVAGSGSPITVFRDGVQTLTASGTVTAGDLVVCAASGAVSTLAAVTTPTAADVTNTRGIVGVALTTATNNPVRVFMAR